MVFLRLLGGAAFLPLFLAGDQPGAASRTFRVDSSSSRVTIKVGKTDFGIEPVSVAGVVNVKNELLVEYRIVARKAP